MLQFLTLVLVCVYHIKYLRFVFFYSLDLMGAVKVIHGFLAKYNDVGETCLKLNFLL